jgi:hypothetical protein
MMAPAESSPNFSLRLRTGAPGEPLEQGLDHILRKVAEKLHGIVVIQALGDLRDSGDPGLRHQRGTQVRADLGQHFDRWPGRQPSVKPSGTAQRKLDQQGHHLGRMKPLDLLENLILAVFLD